MDVFKVLASLDKDLHDPKRLAIMSILEKGNHSDYLFLTSELEMTKGNLAAHLTTLEKMGYVKRVMDWIEKDNIRQKHTMIYITEVGKEAIKNHWKKIDTAMETLRGIV